MNYARIPPLGGKIAAIDPTTGRMYSAEAGLGKVYPISLPIIGTTTIDIPVDMLAHDMVTEAGADIWKRATSNWYYFVGGALLVAAATMVLQRSHT